MKKSLFLTGSALALVLSCPVANSDPIVPDGYTVERYATGIGAANALALGPDGLLYITDYQNGQLLRRTAAGGLEVVASGLPYAVGLAILPNGRTFVAANTSYVYEIIGGTPQVLASGFSFVTSVAAKGDDLFVSNSGNNTISRISIATGSVATELSGVVNPFGISFDALGNMYFISHSAGQIITYNFVDPPRVLTSITASGGTYTGFGFDGRLFWGDYQQASLYRLRSDGLPEVFATGFAGGASPPAIGPNGIVAQGANSILVADGHNVWRISRRPEAAGVLQERGMQVKQAKNGAWFVTCSVQYTGVRGDHQHDVSMDVVGPGIFVGSAHASLGPRNRSFVMQDAGVQAVQYALTATQLWMERTVYLSAAPARGDLYYCEASGQDVTDGSYLRTTHMEDISY